MQRYPYNGRVPVVIMLRSVKKLFPGFCIHEDCYRPVIDQ